MARNAVEKATSINAQLRLLAPKKLSEDDKLVEYDALLLDRFLDILVWLELAFLWPLAVATLYGVLARRRWAATTSLMAGVSTLTSMSAILGEILGSGKATQKLLQICAVGIGLPVYTTYRAIEKKDQNEKERWLLYWAAYGSFSIMEVFADKLLSSMIMNRNDQGRAQKILCIKTS